MKTRVAIALLLLIGFDQSLSYGKSTIFKASSVHSAPLQAMNAFDGDLKTRWASKENQAAQFLQVDFGQSLRISQITIVWEHAFAREYEIQVSDNAADW